MLGFWVDIVFSAVEGIGQSVALGIEKSSVDKYIKSREHSSEIKISTEKELQAKELEQRKRLLDIEQGTALLEDQTYKRIAITASVALILLTSTAVMFTVIGDRNET